MIVAYLAYSFFPKIRGIPVFPTSCRVPNRNNLCFWWLKKSLSFPPTPEGNECHLGDDWTRPAKASNTPRIHQERGSGGLWRRGALETLAALSQLPWHSKYPKNKGLVYLWEYLWEDLKSRLPTQARIRGPFWFCVCAVLICFWKTVKFPSLEMKIAGLGTTNPSCGWSMIRDHRAFLSSLNRGVLVEASTGSFFSGNLESVTGHV